MAFGKLAISNLCLDLLLDAQIADAFAMFAKSVNVGSLEATFCFLGGRTDDTLSPLWQYLRLLLRWFGVFGDLAAGRLWLCRSLFLDEATLIIARLGDTLLIHFGGTRGWMLRL